MPRTVSNTSTVKSGRQSRQIYRDLFAAINKLLSRCVCVGDCTTFLNPSLLRYRIMCRLGKSELFFYCQIMEPAYMDLFGTINTLLSYCVCVRDGTTFLKPSHQDLIYVTVCILILLSGTLKFKYALVAIYFEHLLCDVWRHKVGKLSRF